MDNRWTIDEARTRLDEIAARAIAGEPQVLTLDNGRTLVVQAGGGPAEQDLAVDRELNRRFVEHLRAAPKGDWALERMEIKPRDVDFWCTCWIPSPSPRRSNQLTGCPRPSMLGWCVRISEACTSVPSRIV